MPLPSPTAFFIAATGQNVGKTTLCLGLVSGLRKRMKSVGYFKPVGQEQVETPSGFPVDKDVLLFHSHFHLPDPLEIMSPVLFPKGFTRDYLDGKISREHMVAKIERSLALLSQQHPLVVVEGTGHTGVGSIVDLNNAQVAAHLRLPLFLVASGGLGSSFDELALNLAQCAQYGVQVKGVFLNRVLAEKREMITHYMKKALARWNLPLLGTLPYDPFLSTPTMADFEQLFDTTLLTGAEFRWRHFEQIRLVATSAEDYLPLITPKQLLITPASREDIVLATLEKHWRIKIENARSDLETGIILTGKEPPAKHLIAQIEQANIPMLFAPLSSFAVAKMVHSCATKIRQEDTAKIKEAIEVVETHVDFDRLLEQVQNNGRP